MISVEDLDFVYSSGRQALKNINLKIEKGEFVAVVGRNGSGKSTFASLLSGLMKPTRGTVRVNGINTRSKKQFLDLRKTLGMVFQNPENQIVFEKVRDDIAFGLRNLNFPETEIEGRIDEIAKIMAIEHFTDSFELSMGQKQRVAIASVLAMNPQCIVFDEPTAMLDPKGKKEIQNIVVDLHRRGLTVVYVTNVIDEVLPADRIVVIENGSIRNEFKKHELFDNIEQMKSFGLEIPTTMDLLYMLKQRGIDIFVKKWAVNDVADNICAYINDLKEGVGCSTP
ncbi:MAG: ATP-binding cassette domain-containing protein [Treponema sp.]|jgi:energy-coupling factor transport system ATP-binding protein|nr:ATP-binding cassette domain-containing protein [Treponema sp.]